LLAEKHSINHQHACGKDPRPKPDGTPTRRSNSLVGTALLHLHLVDVLVGCQGDAGLLQVLLNTHQLSIAGVVTIGNLEPLDTLVVEGVVDVELSDGAKLLESRDLVQVLEGLVFLDAKECAVPSNLVTALDTAGAVPSCDWLVEGGGGLGWQQGCQRPRGGGGWVGRNQA